jgi:predicted transcriptional regulator
MTKLVARLDKDHLHEGIADEDMTAGCLVVTWWRQDGVHLREACRGRDHGAHGVLIADAKVGEVCVYYDGEFEVVE